MTGVRQTMTLASLAIAFFGLPAALCGAETIEAARYITLDEIEPGMSAYCLTVYKGTEVEKFDMEIVSVARDFRPGRDIILAKGTDPRFIHTGIVGGCSGSPLYIEGRLAGALALGWSFSKDPLYGVTPIEDMLAVGSSPTAARPASAGLNLDFSKPLDLESIYERIISAPPLARKNADPAVLPLPLIASGISAGALEPLKNILEPAGFVTLTGGGGIDPQQTENVTLECGSALTVPLVYGDIKLTTLGTVTEVTGDKVYGFGHAFLGYGPVQMPMATGYVNTVIASLQRSFKLGNSLEIKGTLTADESTAVFGQIGEEPPMIPLKIKVNRYNDVARTYNCKMAKNKTLTPLILSTALQGAALVKGDLPPEHLVRYDSRIQTSEGQISTRDISTGRGISPLVVQTVSTVGLLMDNPFKPVEISSVEYDLDIQPENISAAVWSVDLSSSTIAPGEQLDIAITLQRYHARRKTYKCKLSIPATLKPGKYKLTVTGPTAYKQFLSKAAPYRFTAENLPTLIEALKNVASIRRDSIYIIVELPGEGLTIQTKTLQDLPASKALLLADNIRTLQVQPYQHWLEQKIPVDSIVTGSETLEINVEQR